MRLHALALLAAAVLPAACATARKAPPQAPAPTPPPPPSPVEHPPLVRAVRIEGAKAFRPQDIAGVLGQRSTHPLHWVPLVNFAYPPVYLDLTAWEQDQIRIANYYALRGYFDARVMGSQLKKSRRTKPDGQPRSVAIIHSVSEGEPSTFRELALDLMEADDPAVAASGIPEPERLPKEAMALAEELGRPLQVLKGRRFGMQFVDDAARVIAATLRARGFARAAAVPRVDAYPEERAVDVSFRVRSGPPAVFGESTIQGLSQVRERYVRQKIGWKAGQPYDGAVVDRAQQAIYDMGLFSMVTLAPDPGRKPVFRDDGTEIVPIEVLLRERKPGTLRGGPGIGVQTDRLDVHGLIGASHLNVFRRLVRAEAELKGGYAFLFGSDEHGPIGHLSGDLRWPDFPVRTLTIFTRGRLELDVERGYQLFAPSADLGLTWSPVRHLKVTASYKLGYYDLFPQERVAQALAGGVAQRGGTTLADGYLLQILREELLLDLRDSPLAAGKGFLGRLGVDEAWGQAGGTADADGDGVPDPETGARYRYLKFSGDLRGYVPLGTKHLVLAGRGAGAYILTLGGNESIPIEEAVYAGGDGSVRGWKSRYLGPRGEQPDCERRDCTLPLGGKVGAWGSLELRGNPFRGLWLAGFTDFGRVWAQPGELASARDFFAGLQFSIGGGIRYDTPLGRIRIDVAGHPRAWTDPVFREPPIHARRGDREQPYWNFHFGIGESF